MTERPLDAPSSLRQSNSSICGGALEMLRPAPCQGGRCLESPLGGSYTKKFAQDRPLCGEADSVETAQRRSRAILGAAPTEFR
jgi:hypothetical protein